MVGQRQDLSLDLSPLAGVHSPYESALEHVVLCVYLSALRAEYSAMSAEEGSA